MCERCSEITDYCGNVAHQCCLVPGRAGIKAS